MRSRRCIRLLLGRGGASGGEGSWLASRWSQGVGYRGIAIGCVGCFML